MNGVLLFLPEIGIEQFFSSLYTCGKSISKNNQITLFHCSGQMKLCHMAANQVPCDKPKLACRKCDKTLQKIKKINGLRIIDFKKFITDEKINELEKIVPANLKQLRNFYYKDIPVGRLSEYELVLQTKFFDIEHLSAPEIEVYHLITITSVLVVEVLTQLFERDQPSFIFAYNPYTINLAAYLIAQKYSCKFVFVNNSMFMGVDWSRFIVTNRFAGAKFDGWMNEYKNVYSFPILPYRVWMSWEDSFFRFFERDSHIFSTAKSTHPEELMDKLGLSKSKKTLLAFTSSNDEMIGEIMLRDVLNEPFPIRHCFSTQVEWLEWLRNYANTNANIQIIIRVHPRETKNSLGECSAHLRLLKEKFIDKKSSNFIMVWPDEPISSYDLIELADVGLINWSSMGYECARVGIPILSYTSGHYYINSLSFFVAETQEDYKQKLEYLLNKEYSFDMLKDGIRYNNWRMFSPVVDLSKTIPHDICFSGNFPVLDNNDANLLRDVCCGIIDPVKYNKEKWLAALNDDSENNEISEILHGISIFFYKVFVGDRKNRHLIFVIKKAKQVFSFLMSRKILSNNNSLIYSSAKTIPNMIYTDIILPIGKQDFSYHSVPHFSLEKNNIVSYAYKEKVYKRYSPLLYRLGKLYMAHERF